MILHRIAFTLANLDDNERSRQFLHPVVSRNSTSFVERVNIPRISFRMEPPSDSDRRAKFSASSAVMRAAYTVQPRIEIHVWPRYAYTIVCVLYMRLDGEERERAHSHAHACRAAAQYAASKYLRGCNKSIWLSLIK